MPSTSDGLSAQAISSGLKTRYLGRCLTHLTIATSTMDVAAVQARDGAPEGMVVITDQQTTGRGRFQRRWISPSGQSLYLSIVLRPRIEHLMALGIVASLAAVRAIHRTTGLSPTIKWPNDVEIAGRKLAGILVDSTVGATGIEYAVVGIGLNVALDPRQHPEIAGIATSLAYASGKPVERLPVLLALLEEFEALYERVRAGESLTGEWRACLSTLGKRVRVVWPGDAERKTLAEEGVAEDVDAEGALLVRRADGSLARLIAGEVSLRG